MKFARFAAPVAVLLPAVLSTACTGLGDDLVDDEESAADREAAEAMVQTVLDIHAAHLNSRRPARLLTGHWQYVSEADTDWSHRLAIALRALEEEMMVASPEAPWLLSSGHADESGVNFAFFDTEDRARCCLSVAVVVWLSKGALEFRASDRVGYIDFVDPPQTVVASVLAEEGRYIELRNAGKEVLRQ